MEVKRPSDSWRNVFRYRKLLSGSVNNMRRRQKIFRAIDRIGVDIPGDDSLVYLRANAGLQPELS